MKDLRVKVSVRNNRLLELIEEKFGSQAEMARQCSIAKSAIYGLVSFRISPITSEGEWSRTAIRLADFLNMCPSDIWPEHLQITRTNAVAAEMRLDVAELEQAAAISGPDQAELRDLLVKGFAALSEREKNYMRWLAAGNINATFKEKGAHLGVGVVRARQIECKAFRKMRNRLLKRHDVRGLV